MVSVGKLSQHQSGLPDFVADRSLPNCSAHAHKNSTMLFKHVSRRGGKHGSRREGPYNAPRVKDRAGNPLISFSRFIRRLDCSFSHTNQDMSSRKFAEVDSPPIPEVRRRIPPPSFMPHALINMSST